MKKLLLLFALALAPPAAAQMTTTFADSPTGGCNGGMAPPSGWNCSQLVFQDQFPGSSLDTTKWVAGLYSVNAGGRWTNNGLLASPLSGINSVAQGGNVQDYYDPAQVTVSGGVLTITMQNSSSQTGYTQVSGSISTYPNYYPTGSQTEIFVQVKEQQPDVNQGAWGGPWMLRGKTTGTELELDIQEPGFIGGGTPYNNIASSDVHVGASDLGQSLTNEGVNLSAGYHIFGMHYQLGTRVDYYFDQSSTPTQSYTSGIISTPVEMMIHLDQAATNTSSFHTCTGSASPACSNTGSLTMPITFLVKEVQIYQR